MDFKHTEDSLFFDLQQTLDKITEKAHRHAVHAVTFKERFFLQITYEGMVSGGFARGFPEAAKLLWHYLRRSGERLEINSEIYQTSAVVKLEMPRQKQRIGAALRSGRSEVRDVSGKLVTEQGNLRLKYADNRFLLHSVTAKTTNGFCSTTWRVDNSYTFEGFKGNAHNWKAVSKWSEFPVRGHKIKVYDGLTKFLVNLGMAKEFPYYAAWVEQWKY